MAQAPPVRGASPAVFALCFTLLLAPQASPQHRTIRTSSSLVLVPVSPLDKSGHFVPNLNVRDFHLFVDNKAVQISNFEEISEGSPPLHQKTSLVLPQDTFRNISEFSASQPNVAILFVDYLNTRMVDRIQLRDELLRFFSTGMRADQEIAVYGLTHSLVLLQPFTRDSSALISVAKNLLNQTTQPADPKVSRPLPIGSGGGGTDGPIEYFTLLNARREYNADQLQRSALTLAAFRELAASFGGIPGKKTVIWLTGDASPLDPTLLYRIIEDKSVQTPETSWWQTAKTYEDLNAAGMSVFPVDIRGILNTGLSNAGDPTTHAEFTQSIRGTQPHALSSYAQMTDFREGEAAHAVLAMESVAEETGATVLAGSNDIGELLARAQKLWAGYYLLAFVPEKPKRDTPSYHKIKVSVDRRGTQVLARRGYVSRPGTLIAEETEIQRDLLEAGSSPIDLTSVALQLSLGDSKDVDQIRHFPFSLTVSDLVLGAPSDKGVPYDLSIAVSVRDSRGNIRTAIGKRVRDTIPQAKIPEATAKALTYNAEFQVPASSHYFGRVIVRDNLTGRIGTITLALPTTP